MRLRHVCALIAGLVLVLNSGCFCHRWCCRRNCRPHDGCRECCAPVTADCGCFSGAPLPPPPVLGMSSQPLPH